MIEGFRLQEAAARARNRGQWRLQVVGNAAEETAADAFFLSFDSSLGRFDRELVAFECQGKLVGAGFEHLPLVWIEEPVRLGHPKRDGAESLLGADDGHEQRNRIGECVGG